MKQTNHGYPPTPLRCRLFGHSGNLISYRGEARCDRCHRTYQAVDLRWSAHL